MSSGFLLSAILLHIVVFLMVATWIIFPTPAELPDASFSRVTVKPPPPPPAPPAAAGGGSQNPLEPQPVVTPPSAPASIVHTEAPANFNMTATQVATPSLPTFTDAAGTSLGTAGAPGLDQGAGSPFGIATSNQQSLAGTFYDMKQTPDHVPTAMGGTKPQENALMAFFASGWDEDSFKRSYFSSSKPIFANDIIIPFQYSASGPAAFGLQNECKPGYWVVIYHAKITSARSGDFYLAGYGDDFLDARVNGVHVLDAGYIQLPNTAKQTKTYPPGSWLIARDTVGRHGITTVGEKFHLDAGADMTLDVLIGDSHDLNGKGRVGFFLFLLEDNKDYPKNAKGDYIFPLLQIHADPNVKRDGEYPPFSCHSEDALTGS